MTQVFQMKVGKVLINIKVMKKIIEILTAIAGNFRYKDLFGCELSEKREKIIAKHFSGSTIEVMRTYIKPPLKCDPNSLTIDVGTN